MNLQHIPTPLTDGVFNTPERIMTAQERSRREMSRHIERNLHVARDTLACINTSQIMDGEVHAKISQVLKLTAPNQ